MNEIEQNNCVYICNIWIGHFEFLELMYSINTTIKLNTKASSLMFHASNNSYCMWPENTLMTTNFVSKHLNLNIILLFNLLLFANALSCCYFVILNYDYFLRTGDYNLFRVSHFFWMMIFFTRWECSTLSNFLGLAEQLFLRHILNHFKPVHISHAVLLCISYYWVAVWHRSLSPDTSLHFAFPRRQFLWNEGCFHTRYLSPSHHPYLHFTPWCRVLLE